MRKFTALTLAGAVAGAVGLISFTLGLAVMVREPGGEPELVTGTIASSRLLKKSFCEAV